MKTREEISEFSKLNGIDGLDKFIEVWEEEESERAKFEKKVVKKPWLDLARIVKKIITENKV